MLGTHKTDIFQIRIFLFENRKYLQFLLYIKNKRRYFPSNETMLPGKEKNVSCMRQGECFIKIKNRDFTNNKRMYCKN